MGDNDETSADTKQKGELNPAFVQNENKESFSYDGTIDKKENFEIGKSEDDVLLKEYEPKEDRRILRNVLIISGSFTLLFTAFNSMASYQSTFNPTDGLGTYSLSTIYGALVVSSMFVPSFWISKLTVKWSIPVAMIGYTVYIAAQFYPRFYTLIPTAILVGLCGAPLWSAKCTYLNHVGVQYSGIKKQDAEKVIVRFFGIFFLFFQSGTIWGNLIASFILQEESDDTQQSEEILEKCGFNFCPWVKLNESENLREPTEAKRFTIAGIFVASALLAIITFSLFVDSLERYGESLRRGASSRLSGFKLLLATWHQMKKPYQLLIIPLTIWSGLEQGYLSSDFTQSFVGCGWGVKNIGFVMICYGICDAIGSFTLGYVVKYTGRVPVFIFGALVNFAMLITMIYWKPNADESYVFFIIAGLWGIADAIWQTQINAFYGILFPNCEEASFSNYRLWESFGFILAYINTNLICIDAKIFCLLGVLAIAMIFYLILEYKIKRKKAK